MTGPLDGTGDVVIVDEALAGLDGTAEPRSDFRLRLRDELLDDRASVRSPARRKPMRSLVLAAVAACLVIVVAGAGLLRSPSAVDVSSRPDAQRDERPGTVDLEMLARACATFRSTAFEGRSRLQVVGLENGETLRTPADVEDAAGRLAGSLETLRGGMVAAGADQPDHLRPLDRAISQVASARTSADDVPLATMRLAKVEERLAQLDAALTQDGVPGCG